MHIRTLSYLVLNNKDIDTKCGAIYDTEPFPGTLLGMAIEISASVTWTVSQTYKRLIKGSKNNSIKLWFGLVGSHNLKG